MKPKSTLRSYLAIASSTLLAISYTHAGQIWDGSGGDNNWNTPANWDSDSLPAFANAITFVGNVRNGAVNDLPAASIIGGINFANDGTTGKTNAFTLTGNSITLGGDIATTATTPVITDTISLAMTLDGNRAITTNTNHNLIVGAPLGETGGARDLVKNGAGTLRFDGINTYSGTSTLNAGTVEVRAGTAGGSAVWGTGPITFSQGTTLYFNPTAQAIQNTSGFTIPGTITLSGGAGTANIRFAGNDNKFPLSGGVTGQAGVAQTLAITQGASGGAGDRQDVLFTGAIADGSGGTLGVSVDFAGSSGIAQTAFVNLRGQNTFTGNLTVTNSRGMNGSGTYPGAWLTIGGERFNGFSAPTTATVGTGFLGAGADYSGNISISNGSGGLTTLSFLTSANQILRGVISGTGSLQQQGTGTLSLTNANTFSGGTTIAAGTLQLATGGALADTGAITLSGGTFDIQTVSDTVGAVTLTSGTITGTSGVLSASSYAVRSGTVSAILGGGALTKTTSGIVTLSGANTFSGTTTVSAGSLVLDYTGNTSKLADGAALILGGGTLTLSGGSHTEVVSSTTLQAGTTSSITRSSTDSVLQLGTVTVNPGSSLVLGAAGIATTNNTNNSLGVLGSWATIAGSGWAVNSTNGANGLITVSTYADVTRLSSDIKTIASSAGNYRIIEGTGIVADVTMAASGTTSVNTLVNNATTAGTVSIGTGNILSTGAILQGTGAGALTIGTFGATAGSLSALGAGGDLAVASNSTTAFTINSVISDNATSTLTKDGAGIVTLTGANTYSGGTSISAGVLAVGLNNGGVGGDNISPDGTSTSLGSGAVSVAAGAALHVNSAGLTIANNITLNGLSYGVNSGGPAATNSGPWNGALMGASENGVISNTFSGTITLNATSNVSTNWNDKTMIITGKVTGAGGLVIDNSAPANRRGGLIRLDNNTNDYAGDTSINAGNTVGAQPTLILGASNVIPNGVGKGNLIVLGNLNLKNVSDTINGLSGSGVITTDVAGTPTLTVGDNNATGLTYSGVIQNGSGTVALAKTGTGTQTLSGNNNYSGGTTISLGTLQVTNSTALGSASGSVSVAAGAKLFLNANSLTIANNITLNGPTTNGAIYCFQPGAGVTTNLTGTLTLNATSNISFWWNDKTLQLSGKITGAGGLDFVLQPSAVGGRYLISGATNDYAGATSVTGNASSIAGYTGQAMLYLGTTNALPTTTALTLNNADLYLNGFSQTLPSISGTGTFAVKNGSTTAATLTLGSGNTTSTFSGTIQDNGISVTNTSNAPTTVTGTVALTKTGNGTLTLTNANTYSGTTAIDGGTLIITGATQATSAITFSGVGKLGLDIAAPVAAANATINFTGQSVLVSGSPTLPSYTLLTASSITGSAPTLAAPAPAGYTLQVVSNELRLVQTATTYASWIAGFPGVGLLNGVNDDPDKDGIANAVEMVLGGNPATGMDTALLPTIELVTNPVSVPAIPAGNYLLFTYRRSAVSEAALVAAACETDTDLVAPWTPAVNAVSGVVIQEDLNFSFTNPTAPADTDRVRVYVPRGANTKLFGRLNVVVP